jgi:hypothetical protein
MRLESLIKLTHSVEKYTAGRVFRKTIDSIIEKHLAGTPSEDQNPKTQTKDFFEKDGHTLVQDRRTVKFLSNFVLEPEYMVTRSSETSGGGNIRENLYCFRMIVRNDNFDEPQVSKIMLRSSDFDSLKAFQEATQKVGDHGSIARGVPSGQIHPVDQGRQIRQRLLDQNFGRFVAIHWDDLTLSRRYSLIRAMLQGGRANDLLGVAYAENHKQGKTRFLLIHPGYTNSGTNHVKQPWKTIMRLMGGLFAQPVERSIRPIIRLMDDPPPQPLSAWDRGRPVDLSLPSLDKADALKLYELTKHLLE